MKCLSSLFALFLCTALLSDVVLAQRETDSGRDRETWTGPIKQISIEGGFITIYDTEYTLESEKLKVYLGNQRIDPGVLQPGFIVSFNARRSGRQGSISRISIIGPEERIRELGRQ